jgi:hypothetical protein
MYSQEIGISAEHEQQRLRYRKARKNKQID